MLEQAQDVNERMPKYVASRVSEILNTRGRAVNGARILVLGVSYKADVGDIRESPALQTMQTLHHRGADVRFHDFFVDEVPLDVGSTRCVEDLDAELGSADVVLLLTHHRAYDLDRIADRASVILDTRNAWVRSDGTTWCCSRRERRRHGPRRALLGALAPKGPPRREYR